MRTCFVSSSVGTGYFCSKSSAFAFFCAAISAKRLRDFLLKEAEGFLELLEDGVLIAIIPKKIK
ncbi:Uncharacterised protein [Chlamydia trachomatis]|nr:Uncharacterised protein [Chlamydia trachomatis]